MTTIGITPTVTGLSGESSVVNHLAVYASTDYALSNTESATLETGLFKTVNGTASAPAYSFTNQSTSGMFATSTGVGLSFGGNNAITACANANVALALNSAPSYGLGAGVVHIGKVATTPSTALTDGGLLYVDGDELHYYNSSGVSTNLTSGGGGEGDGDVTGPVESTNNAVARFDLETGKVLQDTANTTISDNGHILTGNGVVGSPTYSFTDSTSTGMYSPATNKVALTVNGAERVLLDASGGTLTGAYTVTTDLTVSGNLTVSGTTTTINTVDLVVEDKDITLGNVLNPTDIKADGGGIRLIGETVKTIVWSKTNNEWVLSGNVAVDAALGVDTITEKTEHSGVNIDGLVLKDSVLGVPRATAGAGTICTAAGGGAQTATADLAGGQLDMRAGTSTGTGRSALGVTFSVPLTAPGTGISDNSMYEKVNVPARFPLDIDVTEEVTPVLEVALTLGKVACIWLAASVAVTAGGDTGASESRTLQIAIAHTAGGYTGEIMSPSIARSRVEESNLSCDYDILIGTDKVSLRVKLTSDLTSPVAVGDLVVVSHTGDAAISYLV